MVSVVIVTYNAVQTLQSCLDSIYQQEDKRIEIIVIDGKSTDGTIGILEHNNSRISHWNSEKDTGIYDAMNKSLSHIKTPWVYFLGADDELLPDFSNFIAELKKPDTIYYANVLYKNKKHSGVVSPYRQAKLGLFHQSIVYPAAVFKKYQYNTRYKIAADYALNMQLHKDREFNFEHLDYTIAKYNDTGISATVVDAEFEKDKLMLILRNFSPRVSLRYLFRQTKQLFRKGSKNG